MPLYSKNLIPSIKGIELEQKYNIYNAPMGTFWLDNFPVSATDYVVVNGSYDIEVQASAFNRNLIMLIPATAGKYYKPSCDTNGDVHIFFYDSGRSRIGQVYNSISNNLTAQAPANCSYIGFCMTNRGLPAGRYYFKNWQLEEVATASSPATPFSMYELGMKQLPSKTDIIAPDILGSSHNFVSGNIYYVHQDVAVGKCKMEALTEGTWNVAIYEWVEGTGKVGNALYQKDNYIGTGVQVYNFGGVELKGGKSYFIGRYDQTNAAAIKRITGADIPAGRYVEWRGGTTLSQTTAIYPTSYYSTFALEFTAKDLKPAKEYPINLINFAKMTRGFYVNDVNGQLVTSGSGTCTTDYIPITPGFTYEFSGMFKTGPLQQRCAYYDRDKNHVGGFYNFDPSFEKVIPANAYFIRLSVSPADFATANMNLKGDTKMKGTKTYPVENILPPLDSPEWTIGGNAVMLDATDRTATFNFPNSSAGSYFCYVPVIPGKNYTISLKQNDVFSKCRLRVGKGSDGSLINSTGIYETSKTITAPAGVYSFYVTLDNNNEKGGNTQGTFTFEEVSITQSDSLLSYKPYANAMKPAILYPKKNLAKPFTDSEWTTSFTTATFNITNKRLEMIGTASQGYAKLIFNVKPNTNYSFSAKHNAKIGVYSSNGGSSVSPYTVNDGATFNSGSYTEVAFYFSNNGLGAGTYYLEDFQIEEGVRTPYEPYELGMKAN